jgi:hypothetical protein
VLIHLHERPDGSGIGTTGLRFAPVLGSRTAAGAARLTASILSSNLPRAGVGELMGVPARYSILVVGAKMNLSSTLKFY